MLDKDTVELLARGLVEIIDDLTCLTEETKKDVKLTKARYMLADK